MRIIIYVYIMLENAASHTLELPYLIFTGKLISAQESFELLHIFGFHKKGKKLFSLPEKESICAAS